MGETTMRFETVMPLRSTGENRALLIAMLQSSGGRVVWSRASERSGGKAGSEHRVSALGLLLRRFVLDDVPVLGKAAAFEAYDVDDDPCRGLADAGEPPMEQHVVAVGNGERILIAHRGGRVPNEIEETFTARRNVRAVLYVVWRPVPPGGRVVPPVEQGFERLEDQSLVLRLLLRISAHVVRSSHAAALNEGARRAARPDRQARNSVRS